MSRLSPSSAAYYQGSFFSCPEQLEALEMCHDMESLSLTAIKTQPWGRLEGWC